MNNDEEKCGCWQTKTEDWEFCLSDYFIFYFLAYSFILYQIKRKKLLTIIHIKIIAF